MLGNDLTTRPARTIDAVKIAHMARKLAEHEGVTKLDHLTPAAIVSWISGPNPKISILVAERQDNLVGYLAYYRTFSLFTGSDVLLVENLYVDPECRGLSVGQRLLAAAAREAKRLGCGRMELSVHSTNVGAQKFYNKNGMESSGYQVFGMDMANSSLPAMAGPDLREGA
eukprot:TRINITY_DN15895_c0_g1_i1.p1 TRINITY_DN15895_c0_g1~~TRINITY_DN15895_c0_g1_i1.p1  ORF type:complete len:170 (-),score=9.45 TRINITY_DN15895_c0_g1_i1:193-702(-)